jgi:3-deoxy-D-manno-octulosonic-acid transferase
VLLLSELELWPNLICEARRAGVKVGVINGRLSQESYVGYRRIRWLMKPVLNQLEWIAVQTREYADRFADLGLPREKAIVAGSLKFDGAEMDRENPRSLALRTRAAIAEGDRVFLAGSTQHPEEEYAIATFEQLAKAFPQLRLILVPRHPERFDEVARTLNRSGQAWTRRSQIQSGTPVERILLVDTVGELGAWWGVADFAFVGGSMGDRGGQNMIEPAAYGAAVSFGPRTSNFRDVVAQLLNAEAAIVVQDAQQLTQFVDRCLNDNEYCTKLGRRSREVVAQNLGATRRTFELIQSILPERSKPNSTGNWTASGSLASNPASQMRKSA